MAAFCGCSGYRAVERPWNVIPENEEFDTINALRTGDRVRAHLADSSVVAGVLANLNDESMVVIADKDDARVVRISIAAIIRLEVYERGVRFREVALVAASSAIVYSLVNPNFAKTLQSRRFV
jgi:hypothetical protein